jgi:hypothetical protein
MLVFPQLVTGAAALYPVVKRSVQRTALNALADGRVDFLADSNAAASGWELHAKGLTAAEWSQIEALFAAVAGRWQSFTFLDPVGNLLAQSENFGVGPWTNGALIQLTTGVSDPFGTTRATRVTNAGQAAAGVAQTLNVPGTFQYCLSVWARSAGASSLTLAQSTAGASATKTFALGTQWTRLAFTAALGQSTDSVTFGASLDAGASADLFGMQVEAQLAPSDYKKTDVRGGVYAKARFAEDKLTVTAQSTDVVDAVIRIVNTGN